MKSIIYKDVVIRPKPYSFEEYVAKQEKKYRDEFIRGKKNEEEHCSKYGFKIQSYYDRTVDEFMDSIRDSCINNERSYWDRETHWYATFPNGRIVRFPKRKHSENDEQFYSRLDKVISKVEKENTTEYGKFAAMMQRIIDCKMNVRNYLIYPTTYGIGLWTWNFHFESDRKMIEDVLHGMGVEYYNEFSDKHWAFRFKISKKEANRMLIASQI